MDEGDSQEDICVGDGAEEHTATAKVLRDILEHHTGLGFILERIMHAELHGNGVEWTLERRCRKNRGNWDLAECVSQQLLRQRSPRHIL